MNSEQVFSFDLNESLLFEKGQEVAEIRSISLEPNISIQSFNEYISIRGVMELQGEYEKKLSSDDGEDSLASLLDSDEAYRYIEQISDIDETVSEFHHRFPVEISVPSYRIDSLDDVTVEITFFDYELPDERKLNLMSTIEIQGINEDGDMLEPEKETESERESARYEAEDDQAKVVEPLEQDMGDDEESIDIDDTFEFEIKKMDESDVDRDEDVLLEQESPKDDSQEQGNLLTEEDQPSAEENKSEAESDRWAWKKKQSQTLAEFFEESNPHEGAEKDDGSALEHVSENLSVSPDDISLSRDDEADSEDKTDLRYLTGMFREDEESYTQMRLCIVQEDDTLESIAERYGTTSMHLASQNKLTEDSVSEGQLLHIPYKAKS